jgi:GNAT superfamily N-acetyltransferase
MIEIRRVGPDDWPTVREIRLAALKDTPDWFWATYEQEVEKPESWWRDFIDSGAWFLAQDENHPVGIAAAIRNPQLGDSVRQLISMWVAPGTRGIGVGARLVQAIKDWARADGARELQLEVTQDNHTAARLYQRCGFEATGRTEPLPRNPALIEHEMRLLLSREGDEGAQGTGVANSVDDARASHEKGM